VSVKRYQEEIVKRMPHVRFNRMEYSYSRNIAVAVATRVWYAARIFFGLSKGSVKHITWFELSHLLLIPSMDRTVVTVYDIIPFERAGDMSFFARMRTWANSIAVKRARRVVTISDYSAAKIHEVLGVPKEHIFVVKPGLDASHFKPGRKDASSWGAKRRQVLLYVGSEDPRQNVDKIIRAVAILKKKYPRILFLKAGNPQWPSAREKLVSLVQELGLQDSVRFLGYVPEEKLPSLYSSADVAVYPCSSAGWGLPPAEAMACGTPVVASGIGPLPEVTGYCAIRINPGSEREIASAIDRILSDKKLALRMSACGIRRSAAFSWGNAASKMDSIYRGLLEEGG